jgi:hypothetical protein
MDRSRQARGANVASHSAHFRPGRARRRLPVALQRQSCAHRLIRITGWGPRSGARGRPAAGMGRLGGADLGGLPHRADDEAALLLELPVLLGAAGAERGVLKLQLQPRFPGLACPAFPRERASDAGAGSSAGRALRSGDAVFAEASLALRFTDRRGVAADRVPLQVLEGHEDGVLHLQRLSVDRAVERSGSAARGLLTPAVGSGRPRGDRPLRAPRSDRGAPWFQAARPRWRPSSVPRRWPGLSGGSGRPPPDPASAP